MYFESPVKFRKVRRDRAIHSQCSRRNVYGRVKFKKRIEGEK